MVSIFDFSATPYMCVGRNVLGSDTSLRNDVQVIIDGEIVTDDVSENGPGERA